jgi:hypothetical protein
MYGYCQCQFTRRREKRREERRGGDKILQSYTHSIPRSLEVPAVGRACPKKIKIGNLTSCIRY